MPLSEHEQRLLEQMERALYAEDPKFVSGLRGTDLRSHYRRRAVQSAAGFILGLILLMTGVVQPSLVAVSVLGFVLMLAAAVFAVTSWRKIAGSGEGARTPASAPKSKRKPAKRGVTERFEDRWRKRRDEQQGGN